MFLGTSHPVLRPFLCRARVSLNAGKSMGLNLDGCTKPRSGSKENIAVGNAERHRNWLSVHHTHCLLFVNFKNLCTASFSTNSGEVLKGQTGQLRCTASNDDKRAELGKTMHTLHLNPPGASEWATPQWPIHASCSGDQAR